MIIVLVGFMGSGKTSVGRLLAGRLGWPFVDTDRIVEANAARSITEIFATEGEAGFRTRERDAVLDQLGKASGDCVLSLGGGAVLDVDVRSELANHPVVHLTVTVPEMLRRVGDRAGARPLLATEDPDELLERRTPLYQSVSKVTVDGTGRPASEVVDEVIDRLGLQVPRSQTGRVTVNLGPRSYPVTVGPGVAADPAGYPPPGAAEKAFIVTHESLAALREPIEAAVGAAGIGDVRVLTIPESEAGKSLDVAASLYAELGRASAHRHDLIVALGGGVVCDVAGFVASTYARGMQLVHVPTSLLAQVDAAIGGKTGVNLPHGKNLVGTIYQPKAVLCDVSFLASCPEAEMRSGMAEVAKYGFIADPDILDSVLRDIRALQAADPQVLTDLVTRCVAIKASIVASDETEVGDRAFLNYGHTFAHGIEASSDFTGIRHGEAVAIGMMAAALTARRLDRVDDACVERHREVLEALGLPTRAELELERLEAAWKHDKKYERGVRFVLLMGGIGKPEAGVRVPREVLDDVFKELAEKGEG